MSEQEIARVSHEEFSAFSAEVRFRLAAIEEQVKPLLALLLSRSGEEEKARAVERRVYKLELAQAETGAKVQRIWLGAAGVVALLEVLRMLPASAVQHLFGG